MANAVFAARTGLMLLCLLSACQLKPVKTPSSPDPYQALSWQPTRWQNLQGWPGSASWATKAVLENSCQELRKRSEWQKLCDELSQQSPEHWQAWLEREFQPYELVGAGSTLFTGYHELEARGSRQQYGRYKYPIWSRPMDLVSVRNAAGELDIGRMEQGQLLPYYSRSEIESGKLLIPAHPIVWLDDPIDSFALQVQGSGRISLDTGEEIRVGYASSNGRTYTSIGRVLIEQGKIPADDLSFQKVRSYLEENPQQQQQIFFRNDRYIFFRELPAGADGPIGALGVALTPDVSVATDARLIPKGAPLFIQTRLPGDLGDWNRLMVSQDAGAAIKGARVDLFFGHGDKAEELAGRMKQSGQFWLLWPKAANPEQLALPLSPR